MGDRSVSSVVVKTRYEPGLLAVYGSLKPGGPAYEDFLEFAENTGRGHLLPGFTDAGVDGTCTVTATLYDRGRYPGVRIGAGVTRVHLMHVADEATWRLIDDYEDADRVGLPSEYARVRIEVTVDGAEPGALVQAWIYEVVDPIDHEPVVAHGDWGKHVDER